MKRIIVLLLCVAACFGLLTGCNNGEINRQDTRTITDGAGRQVEVPEAVESIVCVGVGALRYTCYVGAQDLVIGVEDYEGKPGMSRLYNYVNFDKFKNLIEGIFSNFLCLFYISNLFFIFYRSEKINCRA